MNHQPVTEMMDIIRVDTFQQFDKIYNKYNDTKDTDTLYNLGMVVLFTCSEDPHTNTLWCTDCREAQPVIEEVIEKFKYNPEITLVIVKVGQSDEWKNPSNPYRKHPLQVTNIPTLVCLKDGSRLMEKDCKDVSKVSHMLSNCM